MRKLIVNVFTTTGMSLVLLVTVALFYRAEYLYISTVFQTFGANFVIHLGLLLLHKLELKYPIIERALGILIVLVTLIVFGAIFRWFASTPIWILVIMGVITYTASFFLDLMRMKKEAQEINALIENRNKNEE